MFAKSIFPPALLCCILSLLIMGCVEDYYIYFPSKYPEGSWDTGGLEFPLEDYYFTTADGIKLHGWFAPQEGAGATILWFHGNAGNLSGRLQQLVMMRRILGVSIFIFDYRGYGRSQGKPSEKGLYRDAEAAYQYLASRPGVSGDSIYLYGQSLGAAVAVYLAHQGLGAGVILEAGFSSLLNAAAGIYPWLPARFLTRERYDSLKRVPHLKMPILIIHGSEDDIMSPKHSQKLYQAASQPKELLIIQGGGHSDLHLTGGKEYWGGLRDFIGGE